MSGADSGTGGGCAGGEGGRSEGSEGRDPAGVEEGEGGPGIFV